MINKNEKLLKRWRQHVERVKGSTGVDITESIEEREARKKKARKDYDFFVTYYFPHYTKAKDGRVTHCAKFHIDAAQAVKKDETIKGFVEWGRGLAKSTHFDIFIPLWLKIQEPRQINTMVLIGKNEKAAAKLMQDIQVELQFNERYINDFGQQLQAGSWEEGDFITADDCAFIALGMGQSPRGARNGANRPDYIVADDLDDDKMVKNPARVHEAKEWILRAVIPTMDIGFARFFLVNNRISNAGILATLQAEKRKWKHFKVNALDEQGNPSWPEKFTKEYYINLQDDEEGIGWKAFETEYQNNPVIDAGRFKMERIVWKPMPVHKWKEYERLVAYFDPSFRSGKKSDYKAIKVWGKLGKELHHLRAFVRQTEITECVKWFYDFHESLPEGVIVYYIMEGKFIQDDFLEDFEIEGDERGYQLPIQLDDEDKGNKEDRIESIIPFWDRGFVYYNEMEKGNADMQRGLAQTLAWDRGSSVNDDGPDADHGAIKELMKYGRAIRSKPILGARKYGNW